MNNNYIVLNTFVFKINIANDYMKKYAATPRINTKPITDKDLKIISIDEQKDEKQTVIANIQGVAN
jgi:hypothetical protein